MLLLSVQGDELGLGETGLRERVCESVRVCVQICDCVRVCDSVWECVRVCESVGFGVGHVDVEPDEETRVLGEMLLV